MKHTHVATAFDETARALFKRAKVSQLVTGVGLFDVETQGGLRNGDIVELYGPSSVGKTTLLYNVIASCVLPRKWNDVSIGGNESGVIYFDNDFNFCMPRFLEIIEQRIKDTLSTSQQYISGDEVKNLVIAALARLHIFRCQDSLQFIITLQSIPLLLENNQQQNTKLLVIDSISSFHWVHKNEDKAGTEAQRQIANECRHLAQNHGLILFATKPIFFKDKKDPNNATTNNNNDTTSQFTNINTTFEDSLLPHHEYLYQWGRVVKYRLIMAPNNPTIYSFVQQQTPNLPNNNSSAPPFAARLVCTFSSPNNTSSSQQRQNKIHLYNISESGISFVS